MPNSPAARPHRIERALAVMAGTVIGLTVLDIVAILIGRAAGADFANGFWRVIIVEPISGLAIGLLLLIAFIIVSGLRRMREARDSAGSGDDGRRE